MNLAEWINNNTYDCHTVVEFGSMFFEQLRYVNGNVKKKVGIEIHQPYIDRANNLDCIKILGDIRHFKELISPEDMDCAMFIDSLEHLSKEDAVDLMGRVMANFNKVILMVPEGNHPQNKDIFEMGADEYQTHKSTWTAEDVKALGFNEILVDPNFHANTGGGKDSGCIFAIWSK